MAPSTPKVGDPVMHHGRLHEITDIVPKARVAEDGSTERADVVVFENDRYEVNGFLAELQWLESDGAWYLPGRLLARDERTVVAAIDGSWPDPEDHLVKRTQLDALPGAIEDLVQMEKLKRVVRNERLVREPDETKEEFEERVTAYAAAAVQHAEELRQERLANQEA